MTFKVERRAAIRHSTAHTQTIVQLTDRPGRRMTNATLINISHFGALVVTDNVAVLHEPLDMRLENAQELGWIAAEAVRFGRPLEVAIRFKWPCCRRVLDIATRRVTYERLGERQQCIVRPVDRLTELGARDESRFVEPLLNAA